MQRTNCLRVLVLLTCIAAFLFVWPARAQDKPEQLIIGKWTQSTSVAWTGETPAKPKRHKTNVPPFIEFHADGTWRSGYESVDGLDASRVAAGTFRWTSDSRIEQTVTDSWDSNEIQAVLIKDVRVDVQRLNLVSVRPATAPQEIITPSGKIKHRAGKPETSSAVVYQRAVE